MTTIVKELGTKDSCNDLLNEFKTIKKHQQFIYHIHSNNQKELEIFIEKLLDIISTKLTFITHIELSDENFNNYLDILCPSFNKIRILFQSILQLKFFQSILQSTSSIETLELMYSNENQLEETIEAILTAIGQSKLLHLIYASNSTKDNFKVLCNETLQSLSYSNSTLNDDLEKDGWNLQYFLDHSYITSLNLSMMVPNNLFSSIVSCSHLQSLKVDTYYPLLNIQSTIQFILNKNTALTSIDFSKCKLDFNECKCLYTNPNIEKLIVNWKEFSSVQITDFIQTLLSYNNVLRMFYCLELYICQKSVLKDFFFHFIHSLQHLICSVSTLYELLDFSRTTIHNCHLISTLEILVQDEYPLPPDDTYRLYTCSLKELMHLQSLTALSCRPSIHHEIQSFSIHNMNIRNLNIAVAVEHLHYIEHRNQNYYLCWKTILILIAFLRSNHNHIWKYSIIDLLQFFIYPSLLLKDLFMDPFFNNL